MGTVSKTLNIVANTTYNLAIDLWAWSIWATEAGISTTYSSLANLLADEKAVRQLMTVHKSVDYLANYPSGADRETLNTIINNDICAKWINISDYAYDTLSANSDIKSVMDTADKYGYGEWGLVGKVPVMTSNTAPSGTVIRSSAFTFNGVTYEAFRAFNSSYSDANGWNSNAEAHPWIGYTFPTPVVITAVKQRSYTSGQYSIGEYKIQGSNDGFANDVHDIYTSANTAVDTEKYDKFVNTTPYTSYRIYTLNNISGSGNRVIVNDLQFLAYEPLGNVPIMTSNTAPYGTASGWDDETGKEAYKAFDGDPSTYKYHRSAPISGTLTNFIVYKFVNPICIKSVKLLGYTMAGSTYSASTYKARIKISNDGTNWTNIYEDKSANNPTTERILKCSDNSDYALYVALDIALTNTTWGMLVYTLQFYGRELTVKQTSAPTDGREYIRIGSNYYTEDWGEKEFAQGSTRKTIYDHGVMPSGAITGGTKNPDCLTLSAVGTATVTIDKGTRTYMGGKAGLHASGTNRLKCGSGYSAFTASNMPDSNGFDISSISGSVAVGIEQTASGTFDAVEIWIE